MHIQSLVLRTTARITTVVVIGLLLGFAMDFIPAVLDGFLTRAVPFFPVVTGNLGRAMHIVLLVSMMWGLGYYLTESSIRTRILLCLLALFTLGSGRIRLCVRRQT